MEKRRELNYDFLRIISCIAVILIHISAIYYYAIYDPSYFGQTIDSNHFSILLLNILGKFAVPCFVMLTGAFVLSNDKNQDRRYLYKKAIKSIFVPTLIIGIFYFIYKEGMIISNVIQQKACYKDMLLPINDFLLGQPAYHMWYMSMLIGLYLIIPDIIKFLRKIEEKDNGNKTIIAIILYLLLCGYFAKSKLQYSLVIFIPYISYLLLGYLIRKKTSNKKSNIKAILFFIITILINCIHAYLATKLHIWNQSNEIITDILGKGAFAPLIILSSITLFISFSYLEINTKFIFKKLPQETLYIYLFHVVVVEVLSKLIIYKLGLKIQFALAIPLYVSITFIISWIITKLYLLIYNAIDKGDKLENKIIKILKLDK